MNGRIGHSFADFDDSVFSGRRNMVQIIPNVVFECSWSLECNSVNDSESVNNFIKLCVISIRIVTHFNTGIILERSPPADRYGFSHVSIDIRSPTWVWV